MENYISLHNHDSKGSLLDSILRIDDIIDFAKENKMDSIALTNHGTMHSYVEFHEKCLKNNIKPIHGCEVYIVSDYEEGRTTRNHLILLAKNKKGIENLFKISKIAYKNFYYKPIIDLNTIEENNLGEGIICLSACLAGYICRNEEHKCIDFINKCKKIFDYFALEVQAHKTEEQKSLTEKCIKIGNENNTPIVITTDSHYKNKNDIEAHSIFIEIGTQREVGETYSDCYLQTVDELKDNCKNNMSEEVFKNAINETIKISNMVEIYDIGIKQNYQMPNASIPKDFKNSFEYFTYLIEKGINTKILHNKEKTIERIKNEIKVLKELDYIDYFLLLVELTELARENNIPLGYSRGSGANCMCLYLLGVTQIDSIRWELDFSRFANMGRKGSGIADYDMDISQEKRDLFISLVKEKYGEDFVIPIATFGTLSTKVAIQNIAKVLDKKGIYSLPYSTIVKEVLSYIPTIKTFNEIDVEKDEEELLKNILEKIPKLKEYYNKYPRWFELVLKLEGLPKSLGKHASGVLITPKPVISYCPICLDSDKNFMCQLDMKDAMDKLSLVKMDFLGLRNLDIIDNVLKQINKKWKDVDINTLDLDDKNVYKNIYFNGNTAGIFQMESFEAKKMAIECQVDNINDVIALNALNRPGAKLSFPDYINNKKNNTISCHKDLIPILKSTNYVLIYQEQMLKIFALAGFDESEQDKARRAVGKKHKEEMEELEEKFKNGFKKLGWKHNYISDLWNLMIKQAEYSFNLGHSASYGLLSYLTAYLKYHYPKEFMCSLLNSVINSSNDIATYIAECKNMNIEVSAPFINMSKILFSINENKIIFGISGIKGIGNKIAEKIIKNNYTSVQDFIKKVNPNTKQMVQLIKAGYFGSKKSELLEKYKLSLLDNSTYEQTTVTISTLKKHKCTEAEYFDKKRQEFEDRKNNTNKDIISKFNETYMTNEEVWEIESLNMFLTKNPFENINFKNFDEYEDKKDCVIVGAIIDIQNKKDKRGKKYVYIKLFTAVGIIEGVVYGSIFDEYGSFIKSGNIITCLCKKDGNQISVKKIKDFFEWKLEKNIK